VSLLPVVAVLVVVVAMPLPHRHHQGDRQLQEQEEEQEARSSIIGQDLQINAADLAAIQDTEAYDAHPQSHRQL
jgi:hypothetical protein